MPPRPSPGQARRPVAATRIAYFEPDLHASDITDAYDLDDFANARYPRFSGHLPAPPRPVRFTARLMWSATAIFAALAFVGGLTLMVANADDRTKVIKPDTPKVEKVSQPEIGFSGDMWASMDRFWDRSIQQRPHSQILTLPVPEPAPTDPYAPEDLPDMGRILIPRLGLDVELHQGVTLGSIDEGPSYWPGTAKPGEFGNMVIAGHRVTHSRPFRDIDQLQPGDRITIEDSEGIPHIYEVTSSEIVTPDRLDIVSQPVGYEATLFACHPPGSADFRFVVHLRLLDWDGVPKTVPPYEIVHT